MKPEFKINGVDTETYSYIREQMSRIIARLNRGWYGSMFNIDSIKIDNALMTHYGDQINVRVSMIRKYTGNSTKENAASLILESSEVMFWNCLGYNAYDTTIKVNTRPISLWQQLYRNRPTKNKSFFKR